MNLQPSTRCVVEEWIGRIAGVDRVLVAFFHAGGKSSIVSATREAEGTKSFSDKAISSALHKQRKMPQYCCLAGTKKSN
jgi:hypothetical protein